MTISGCPKLLLITLLSFCLPVLTNAQDRESDSSDAVKVMQEINQHMKAGEWNEVADRMTEKAWDDWCETLVVECISLAGIEIDMGFAMPGMEKAQEEINDVLEKHELDQIEIETPSIEIHMGEAGDDDQEEDIEVEDSEDVSDEQSRKILDALDADNDRYAVVQELWKARSSSPFSATVFGGKVEKQETENEVVNLTITPTVVTSEDDQPGVVIQIMAPPVVVNIQKVKGTWKYAGTNEEKSAEAMKNFKPDMMMDGRREDF